MSVHIGYVNPRNMPDAITDTKIVSDVIVQASRGGVELHSVSRLTLDPAQARNYAALLVRAADETERMRARPDMFVEPLIDP
jgi:deoxyadenosine/deoxycytidine kinase